MGFALMILFVIFGGGYYAIRFLIESGKNEADKEMWKRYDMSIDEFKKMVCLDKDTESDLIDFVFHDSEAAEARAREIVGDLAWFEKLKHSPELIKMILFADKGKVPSENVVFGYNPERIFVQGITKEEAGKAKSESILWMLGKLKEHGVDTRIIVEYGDKEYRYLSDDCLYNRTDKKYMFECKFPFYMDKSIIK